MENRKVEKERKQKHERKQRLQGRMDSKESVARH